MMTRHWQLLLVVGAMIYSLSLSALTDITKPARPQKQQQTKSGTTVSNATGSINGYGYVDLGLSVKWAICNVGAWSPEDYGNYYAWGETRTKFEYIYENSVTARKRMGSIAGDPKYDAARANWGGTWRLPTLAEIDELINKCKWTWTTLNGVYGCKITGPNGNSIFLPAAGYRGGSSLDGESSLRCAGDDGEYWSATPYGDSTYLAYGLNFVSGYFKWYCGFRSYGQPVRPVSE